MCVYCTPAYIYVHISLSPFQHSNLDDHDPL